MENITVKTFSNYSGYDGWTGWKPCEATEFPATYAELRKAYFEKFLVEVTVEFKGETFEKVEAVDCDSTEEEFNRFVALLKKFA